MSASLPRRFSVHGIEEAPSHGHLIDGLSFEDAALHYLEDHHLAAPRDEVSLFVEDCGTGERQCFRIDLATGETAPCD
ncbi:MAG: DUF5961 family protein [Caulobacterales bacterium]|jgi:hypothetical protein